MICLLDRIRFHPRVYLNRVLVPNSRHYQRKRLIGSVPLARLQVLSKKKRKLGAAMMIGGAYRLGPSENTTKMYKQDRNCLHILDKTCHHQSVCLSVCLPPPFVSFSLAHIRTLSHLCSLSRASATLSRGGGSRPGPRCERVRNPDTRMSSYMCSAKAGSTKYFYSLLRMCAWATLRTRQRLHLIKSSALRFSTPHFISTFSPVDGQKDLYL